jgi:TolB-like protein
MSIAPFRPGSVAVVMVIVALVLPAAAVSSPGPRLLVTPFSNHTGSADFDPLGRGLADMILTDLAGVDGLTVVERARLPELIAELDLQRTARIDPATAQAAGKLVGASHAVTGSIHALEPRLRLDIRLVDVTSGEVLLAEQVTGSRDAFFELEQELVGRFVVGLGRERSEGASATKLERFDSALAYGQALDQADRGDLEGASRTLGGVVAAEPGFKLGQEVYADVMRRLYAARERRTGALSELSRQLLVRCDEELAKGPVEALDEQPAQRYFGYRVLAGNVVLGRLSELIDHTGPYREKTIPEGDRDLVIQLMRDHAANTETYIGEMKAWYAAHPDEVGENLEGQIADEDERLAEKAALGDAGTWDFADPADVSRDLAEFILQGRPDFYGDLNFEIRPSLGQLDPAWKRRGFDWLQRSLDDCALVPDEELRQLQVTRTLETWAEILRAEGRTVEAITRWQMILDRYPTHEDYRDYERKIKEALGTP